MKHYAWLCINARAGNALLSAMSDVSRGSGRPFLALGMAWRPPAVPAWGTSSWLCRGVHGAGASCGGWYGPGSGEWRGHLAWVALVVVVVVRSGGLLVARERHGRAPPGLEVAGGGRPAGAWGGLVGGNFGGRLRAFRSLAGSRA